MNAIKTQSSVKSSDKSTCNAKCPYCGVAAGQVYVHGHYQCNNCKMNVNPCCGGETILRG